MPLSLNCVRKVINLEEALTRERDFELEKMQKDEKINHAIHWIDEDKQAK